MIHEVIPIQVEGSMDYAKAAVYMISDSWEIGIKKRPVVVICPGGGYCFTSEREAEMFALKWNACGYHSVVLWYSVKPAVYPTALLEVASVMKLLQEKQEEWHVDVNKIFVQGSSAGGHLAASYGMFWAKDFVASAMQIEKEKLRPAGMILNYPVITSGEYAHKDSFVCLLDEKYDQLKDEMSLETQVTENTPPAFIWHTNEDGLVPAENSLFLALEMRKKNIPVELHLYMKGHHGLALANELTVGANGENIVPSCESWFELAYTWTKEIIAQ